MREQRADLDVARLPDGVLRARGCRHRAARPRQDESFGPTLLSKLLGLNATQESSLGLVLHYAESKNLTLIDLGDQLAVLTCLTGDEGRAQLKGLGGRSASTVGVILRELIGFADEGADSSSGSPRSPEPATGASV